MAADQSIDFDAIYEQETGRVFMSGIQALVRLPLMQRRLDRSRGHKTAGLVTGYRGSPLGAYDQELWRASKQLTAHDVVFQPALNEDLAATALWGAQMHRAYGPSRVEGVFGIWYGKGPGVDRSGDVFRAANMLGTSPLGGVLAVAGDDHAAQSSMYPHQTDGIFQSVMMPILQPSDVAEILPFGLAGFALSRSTGLWVAMKAIAEVVESAATFELPEPYPLFRPLDNAPVHGFNWDPRIAWPAQRAEYERRLLEERIPAAIAWVGLNKLDRVVAGVKKPKVCFVTVGKAHQDFMQALDDLGLSATDATLLGASIYKVAMSWPLDSGSLLKFAQGAETIFVIEEKQPVVENQLRSALYNQPADRRPRIIGKTDEAGRGLLSAIFELNPLIVARAITPRLAEPEIAKRLKSLELDLDDSNLIPFPARKPFFCSGCPHNRSTKTPSGSIAGGGIGCHVMALSQPSLNTSTFSQMGGEGLQWVGAAPFSETAHVFQNIGDGTYQHSGLLAIRAAIAAKTPITYKILYNDAVAMTGGQRIEGNLDPLMIARQLAAEGITVIRLVSDEPDKWRHPRGSVRGLEICHRDELDVIQRELRTIKGVTAIIYEQTCATERRRRRKRGSFPQADRRLFINSRVCEGCGDCSVQSNCIAVEPLETGYGRKRRINQSSCNQDFSCVRGFCPSFVEVDGAVLRKPDPGWLDAIESKVFTDLPDPEIAAVDGAYNIYVAGIGGGGVLTLGSLLGLAGYLSHHEVTVLDFTGLAQKNGAVVSQVRFAPAGQPIASARIGPKNTDLMLAVDPLVAVAPDGLRQLAGDRSVAVVNIDETPTADAVLSRDASLPTAQILKTLRSRVSVASEARFSKLAQALFGEVIATNVMLIGYAWQQGFLPLSREAIETSIQSHGQSVALNLRAFSWGRYAAIDLAEVERIAGLAATIPDVETIETLVARYAADLEAYQDVDYSRRYQALVSEVRIAASTFGEMGERFTRAVAANAYKLMAYKDEYEVARLYGEREFQAALTAEFSDHRHLSVWLAPPLLSRNDPSTGRPIKRRYGRWVFTAMRLLAYFRFLRGTWADPFGHTGERRTERALIVEYFELVRELSKKLDQQSLPIATAIAELPADIRGFGPVKAAAIKAASARRRELQIELAAQRETGARHAPAA